MEILEVLDQSEGAQLEADSPVSMNGEGLLKTPSKLEGVERYHILEMLDTCEWRIEGTNGAATILGVNSSTLRSRMNKLGIKRPKTSTVTSSSKN